MVDLEMKWIVKIRVMQDSLEHKNLVAYGPKRNLKVQIGWK